MKTVTKHFKKIQAYKPYQQNLINQVSSIKVFPPNKLASHIKKHLKIQLTPKKTPPNETLSFAAENLPKLALDASNILVDASEILLTTG